MFLAAPVMRSLWPGLMGLLLCLLVPPARAEPCDGSTPPQEAVGAVFERLKAIHRGALPGPDGAARRDSLVLSLVQDHVAAERFTSEVLRRPWSRAQPAQKALWSRVLGTLLQRRVIRALGDPLGYTLTVGEVSVEAECRAATVQLTLKERRRTRTTNLTLRLERVGSRWAVWDIGSSEVSMVRTWRSRLSRTTSLDGELARLARRLGVSWPTSEDAKPR